MATAVQTRCVSLGRPRWINPWRRSQKGRWLYTTGRVEGEVRILLGMMQRTGATAEEVRNLINLPADLEKTLLAYCWNGLEEVHPEDVLGISRVLCFRWSVAEEFERQLLSRESA